MCALTVFPGHLLERSKGMCARVRGKYEEAKVPVAECHGASPALYYPGTVFSMAWLGRQKYLTIFVLRWLPSYLPWF